MEQTVVIGLDAIPAVILEGGIGFAGAMGKDTVGTVFKSIGDGYAVVGGECSGAAYLIVVVGRCAAVGVDLVGQPTAPDVVGGLSVDGAADGARQGTADGIVYPGLGLGAGDFEAVALEVVLIADVSGRLEAVSCIIRQGQAISGFCDGGGCVEDVAVGVGGDGYAVVAGDAVVVVEGGGVVGVAEGCGVPAWRDGKAGGDFSGRVIGHPEHGDDIAIGVEVPDFDESAGVVVGHGGGCTICVGDIGQSAVVVVGIAGGVALNLYSVRVIFFCLL